MEEARKEGRKVLTERETKEILKEIGIPVNVTRLAKTKKEALQMAQELGYPMVLKISSVDIVHKSDVGGVALNLPTKTRVGRAYRQIMTSVKEKCPAALIEGVTVQKMLPGGVEVIIGMSRDAQFGPVLMFGLGGVWVEVLKDVSFRIAPLTREDAREMMAEIKGRFLLEGYRGQEPVDLGALEEILLRLADFAERVPEVEEVDLNPVLATGAGAVVVDARIILGGE